VLRVDDMGAPLGLGGSGRIRASCRRRCDELERRAPARKTVVAPSNRRGFPRQLLGADRARALRLTQGCCVVALTVPLLGVVIPRDSDIWCSAACSLCAGSRKSRCRVAGWFAASMRRPEGFGADPASRTRSCSRRPKAPVVVSDPPGVGGNPITGPTPGFTSQQAGRFFRGLPARCSGRSVRPGEGHHAPPTPTGSSTFFQSPGLSPNLFRSPQIHPFGTQVHAQSIHSAGRSRRCCAPGPDCLGAT